MDVLFSFTLRIINSPEVNKLISANEIDKISGGKVMEKHSSQKSGTEFLIFGAKLTFTELRYTINIPPVLHHFDLECHIQIKIKATGYVISEIFSQLILHHSNY